MDLQRRRGDDECFDYHRDYVAKVPDGDILVTLTEQGRGLDEFIRNIPPNQLNIIHPPYGWRIRTVIEHCCDAERVFGYRIRGRTAGQRLLFEHVLLESIIQAGNGQKNTGRPHMPKE